MEQIIKTLKSLQDLQVRAIQKGVNSFHLNTLIRDNGKAVVRVSVFLKGDESEGDYLSATIYEGFFTPELEVARIAKFIGED